MRLPLSACAALVSGLVLVTSPVATARADTPTYTLSIKDHKFDPATIEIPAGQKVKLIVHNLDSTPEEFESAELNREKIVPAGGKVTVLIGPLKPGDYPFMGEFHQDTAKGVIRAKGNSE